MMKSPKVLVLSLIFGLLGSQNTFAYPTQIASLANAFRMGFASLEDYRVGDEWGKKPITVEELKVAPWPVQRSVMATARVGGATGFYLGRFAGRHVMATNHHVIQGTWDCTTAGVRFAALEIATRCQELLGTWPEIDLSLFVIQVPASKEEGLARVAANFDFSNELVAGMPLITVGYGVAGNPNREIRINQDSDCKVFSRAGEFRALGDPDELNPGPDRVWSFSNGCDVSHGDSGSAMVERATGKVIGLIWTGKIPKSPEAQSSAQLARWLEAGSEEIWKELSFGVPARKISEHLHDWLTRNEGEASKRQVVQAVLAQ